MAPQIFIDYGGLTGRGLTGTFTRGVSPSTFTLYCKPQHIPDGGAARLIFGQGSNYVEFQDCAIAGAFVRPYSGAMPLMAVHLHDRRWRWKFSVVSGHYNVRTPEGLVDPATKKEPSELAALILQAMGETNITVDSMPTGVYPPADWVNKRADLALQELCDYIACDVVLNWQSNGVEIHPLGTGSTTEPVQTAKYTHVPRTNVPATIEVRTGPCRWQTKLKLAAVIRASTGNPQKRINDAAPSGFWQTQSVFSFQSITDPLARALCFGEMWRLYRVVGQADGTVQPPFCQLPISKINQYLLEDHLIESEIDLEGYKRQMPAYLTGSIWAFTDLPNNCTEQYLPIQFKLHKDRRLVEFEHPVHAFNDSAQPTEPTLYLITSYKLESTAGELIHLRRFGSTGSTTGGTLILERPEIFPIYNNVFIAGSQSNTEQQAFTEAEAYVQLFLRKYQNPFASEVTYPGFVPGLLDGNLAAIKWNLSGNSVPYTVAYEHEELDVSAVSRNERRRREKLDALAEPVP